MKKIIIIIITITMIITSTMINVNALSVTQTYNESDYDKDWVPQNAYYDDLSEYPYKAKLTITPSNSNQETFSVTYNFKIRNKMEKGKIKIKYRYYQLECNNDIINSEYTVSIYERANGLTYYNERIKINEDNTCDIRGDNVGTLMKYYTIVENIKAKVNNEGETKIVEIECDIKEGHYISYIDFIQRNELKENKETTFTYTNKKGFAEIKHITEGSMSEIINTDNNKMNKVIKDIVNVMPACLLVMCGYMGIRKGIEFVKGIIKKS